MHQYYYYFVESIYYEAVNTFDKPSPIFVLGSQILVASYLSFNVISWDVRLVPLKSLVMLQSYPEAKVQLVSFFFHCFFSYRNHIVWTFPCADFKPRAEPACLCDELEMLSSVWETNASFAEQMEKNPCTLPKQKQVFHHNVKSQGIVCSRRKRSKLQRTIMKGHGTQSWLCFSAARDASSSPSTSSSIPFYSYVPS